jgi:hypothetical protein
MLTEDGAKKMLERAFFAHRDKAELDAKFPQFWDEMGLMGHTAETGIEVQLWCEVLWYYHFGIRIRPSLLDSCTMVNSRFGRRLDYIVGLHSKKREGSSKEQQDVSDK